MALLNEFEEQLHYPRPKPARCLELLELAPCVLGQGAELLSEGVLELVPCRGVPTPLELLQPGAHFLVGHYWGELGISVLAQGEPCLEAQGLW
jgi:hypothetical protein